MSGADQLTLIDAEDPEYYAELLCKIPRPANRRLPSDGRSCPDICGIQKVDVALSRRLQTLLDAVADISLCQRGNVSATMASLKDNTGILETKLYIPRRSAFMCARRIECGGSCKWVQSRTTKVRIFNNSQTRVFGYKLTSDSDSAPSKTPRNGCFQKFPQHLRTRQNFEQNFCYYRFHSLVNPPPRQLSYPSALSLEPSWPSWIQPYDLSVSWPPKLLPLWWAPFYKNL